MEYVKVKTQEFTDNQKWDCDTVPELEGVLVERKSNVGTFNKNLYVVKASDGLEYAVWGTANLDRLLGNVVTGTHVKIVYLGKKKTKTGGYYKAFEVYQAVSNGIEAPKDIQETADPAPKVKKPVAKKETPKVDEQLTDDDCPF